MERSRPLASLSRATPTRVWPTSQRMGRPEEWLGGGQTAAEEAAGRKRGAEVEPAGWWQTSGRANGQGRVGRRRLRFGRVGCLVDELLAFGAGACVCSGPCMCVCVCVCVCVWVACRPILNTAGSHWRGMGRLLRAERLLRATFASGRVTDCEWDLRRFGLAARISGRLFGLQLG